jgi:hypothetical protein
MICVRVRWSKALAMKRTEHERSICWGKYSVLIKGIYKCHYTESSQHLRYRKLKKTEGNKQTSKQTKKQVKRSVSNSEMFNSQIWVLPVFTLYLHRIYLNTNIAACLFLQQYNINVEEHLTNVRWQFFITSNF